MKVARETSQSMQRVKVGLIGLAGVVLLIAFASALLGSISRERVVTTAGSAQADVVANIAADNAAAPDGSGEPLAELGVAPSTANSQSAAKK